MDSSMLFSTVPSSAYTAMLLSSEPPLEYLAADEHLPSPSTPASPWTSASASPSPSESQLDSPHDDFICDDHSSASSSPEYSLSPRVLPSLPSDLMMAMDMADMDMDMLDVPTLPPFLDMWKPNKSSEGIGMGMGVASLPPLRLPLLMESAESVSSSSSPLSAPVHAPAESAPAEAAQAPAESPSSSTNTAAATVTATVTPSAKASATAPAQPKRPRSSKSSRAPSKRTHTSEPRRFACPDCPNSYTRRDGLARHVRSVHTLERPYSCDECGDAFALRSSLVEHMRRHTGEKPYSCRRCDMSFASNKSMHRHEFTQHGLNPAQPKKNRHLITCDTCDRTFKRQDQYKAHLKTHNNATHSASSTFICGTCQASLSSQAALDSHMQTHIPITTRMSSYLNELDVGSDDMLSYLDDSNMTTTLSVSSVTHHLFSCPEPGCGRLFSYASTLQQHRRSAHGRDSLSIPSLKDTVSLDM